MTEPQESLGSLGPFYGFQTAGLEDNIEMEILKSFLSPDAELPSNQTAPLFTQSTQTGIQAYAPQAFPANRFEVVAESGSQYPVDVFQPQGQASQVSILNWTRTALMCIQGFGLDLPYM
jgi:hypothetical protein